MRPSQATELKLMGLLDAAEKAGYPMKVSLLGDESDVNDKPEMLRHPQRVCRTTSPRSSRRSSVPLERARS